MTATAVSTYNHIRQYIQNTLWLKSTLIIIPLLILAGCAGLSTTETDCSASDTFTVTVFEDINDSACDLNHCSLREAVIAANTCTDFPKYNIELPGGIYTLTIRGPEDERGDLDITRDTSISRADSGTVIITGEDTWIYRIFEIHNNVDVEITNVSIMGGNTTEDGGGIYNEGNLELLGVYLIENKSNRIGGGLYNDGTATLTGVIISDNRANPFYPIGCGGGIFNAGMIQIDFTSILNNDAYHGAGICNENGELLMSDALITENGVSYNGLGGGIYSTGGLNHLENVTISENRAKSGGGIYFADGLLEILFSQINNNNARLGGGVYLAETAHADFDYVRIEGNSAARVLGRDGAYADGDGGGLYIATNNWDLYQSPVTNNQALGSGGGLYIDARGSGQGYYSHSAIAYNIAPLPDADAAVGAAVYVNSGNVLLSNATISNNDGLGDGSVYFNGAEANTRLVHVTMADNNIGRTASAFSDPYIIMNISGGTLGFLNSLILGVDGKICAGAEAGYYSDGGNVAEFDVTCSINRSDDSTFSLVPSGGLILPLMEIDGTLVHVLLPGSDAIDFVTSDCVRDDQRLTSRPVGTQCDSGAFEWDAETLSDIGSASDDKDDGDKDNNGDSDDKDDKDDGDKGVCEFIAAINLFCRTGPGSVYKEIDSLVPQNIAAVLGISPDGFYVQIEGPNFGASCYVPVEEKFGSLSGACSNLTVLPVPPTPIPTATPTFTPEPAKPTKVPPPQPTPTCDQNVNCTNQP